jgi:Rnl2 family RNA ligase
MAPITFVSYAKIADRLEADEAAHRALARVPWVVMEKIHGANLALASDGDEVRAAKRKALLDPGDEFFGWGAILERYGDAVRALAKSVAADDGDVASVIVYGELFGGGYPHPDVAAVAGVEPVQTGVWYAPGIEWRAFDVAVVRHGAASMFDWEAAEPLFAKTGVPYVRPLLVGKMNDAQNYALGFETRIPAELGLPRIDGNRAEGIVIKPARAVTVDSEPVAPRIKRKLEEFAEDERFHGAQKWSAATRGGTKQPTASTLLLDALRARINEPRIHAARSKIGRVRRDDRKRRAELQAMVIDEVLDEVQSMHSAEWQRLATIERDVLRTQVATDVASLIERILR